MADLTPSAIPAGADSGRCPLGCSGRGRCRADGACECLPGYAGHGCAVAVPRCPADCNGHGACVDGMCECAAGWEGGECAQAAYSCASGCGGHGLCVAATSALPGQAARPGVEQPAAALSVVSAAGVDGVCVCDAGYSGATCEAFILPAAVCLHNCSGRGTCTVGGTCACMPGRTGAACELADAATDGFCPKACCGHGHCRLGGGPRRAKLSRAASLALGHDGRPTAPVCVCEASWRGADCCEPVRQERCPHACSGNGVCLGSSGVCACDAGWAGASCAGLDLTACPRACSAHGECRGGACHCERGFSGDGCQHGDAFGPSSQNWPLPLYRRESPEASGNGSDQR